MEGCRRLVVVLLVQHRKRRKEQGEEPVRGGRLVDDPQVAEAGRRSTGSGGWSILPPIRGLDEWDVNLGAPSTGRKCPWSGERGFRLLIFAVRVRNGGSRTREFFRASRKGVSSSAEAAYADDEQLKHFQGAEVAKTWIHLC